MTTVEQVLVMLSIYLVGAVLFAVLMGRYSERDADEIALGALIWFAVVPIHGTLALLELIAKRAGSK